MISQEVYGPDTRAVAEIRDILAESFTPRNLQASFSYSANRVFSGVLEAAQVVIKPFEGFTRDRAEHELFVIDLVRGLGIPTLKPRSLLMAESANFLITEFEPEIKPLDQINYRAMPRERFHRLANNMGSLVRKLHDGGIIHGDCRLKNYFRRQDDHLGGMDWELAEVYMDPWDAELLSGCDYDLERLTSSAAHVMGEGKGNEFNDHMLASYYSPVVP